MKIYKLIMLFICLIISISAVSAADVNSSDVSNQGSEILSDVAVTDEISNYNSSDGFGSDFSSELCADEVSDILPSSNRTVDLSISECCSFIIQENNGETVYAFRQDSPLYGTGVVINSQEWYGRNIIKQEIESQSEYFFHSIITEDGWVIGQGGSQYDDDSMMIERIAGAIVSNNYISTDYLRQIRDILYDYHYGHFVVKAPDGRYGIAFYDRVLTGTLYPGQFMVIPNYIEYYQKGNYNDYGADPVDAIIQICSYDDSGLNRRNLYTYDYKVHDTPNGLFYGADIYVTNDNGHNVGLDTSRIVTHFYYEGNYYPAFSIPQNPGKLYVGTHIFENTAAGNMIELIDGPSNVLINDEDSVSYSIKLLTTEYTVEFDLGNDIDFINAYPSLGSFIYDSQQHKLYWNLPAINMEKNIIIYFKPRSMGNHNIRTAVQGKSEVHDFSYYVTDYGAHISVSDVDKYAGGPQKLNVYLKDNYGNPLIGECVGININGVNYYRFISDQGYASLALNLDKGEYDAVVSYYDKIGEDRTTAHVTIRQTAFGEDIVKYFKNGTQFYASFLDTDGSPLKNSDVLFNINGVFYTRSTNENGVARLNINLEPGEYIITSINLASGEMISNSIRVKSVLAEYSDMVKYYRNGTQYTIKVLDGQGNPLSNVNITFNINGVFYTRTTNESGIAKLNINLNPGDYIITADYNGEHVSNYIMILERVVTEDLVMKYRDGSKFEAIILDEQGNTVPGENLTFNINGVLYNRTTDENGNIALNINLMPGQYIITTAWNGYRKSNVITIS